MTIKNIQIKDDCIVILGNTIFVDVMQERLAQRKKWGKQEHSLSEWIAILGEEYGEVCRKMLENDHIGAYTELIQVAAVAIAIASNMPRLPEEK